MLKKGHNDVKLSKSEMHRITLWLECNSDFFGAYEDTEAQPGAEIVQPFLERGERSKKIRTGFGQGTQSLELYRTPKIMVL